MCDMTQSNVWRDSSLYVSCLTPAGDVADMHLPSELAAATIKALHSAHLDSSMCDMTQSNVWHDSSLYVSCLTPLGDVADMHLPSELAAATIKALHDAHVVSSTGVVMLEVSSHDIASALAGAYSDVLMKHSHP